MRFHGRRTGEIPSDILRVGHAEREIGRNDVVLIVFVLRKIIVGAPEMVIVICVHAIAVGGMGMRSATGAEPRAMRPGRM